MAYSFVNWDDEDIGGQNYRDFMDLCFRYSQYFAFRYEPEIKNDRPNPFFVKELPALAPFMVESFPMRCWSCIGVPRKPSSFSRIMYTVYFIGSHTGIIIKIRRIPPFFGQTAAFFHFL